MLKKFCYVLFLFFLFMYDSSTRHSQLSAHTQKISSENQFTTEAPMRWTILETGQMLARMDNDFRDYIDHWRAMIELLPRVSDRELTAKIKLMSLLCIQRSLSRWMTWRTLPEYRRWLQLHVDRLHYSRGEDIGWFLKTDEYWDLHEEYVDLPASDEIAWEAANNPKPDVCEASPYCYFLYIAGTFIKYMELHPDGKYASLAMERINKIFDRLDSSWYLSGRLQATLESTGERADAYLREDAEGIVKILERLDICLDSIADKGIEVSSLELNKYGGFKQKYLKDIAEKPHESAEDLLKKEKNVEKRDHENVVEIKIMERRIRFLHNLDFVDLLDVWEELNRLIPSIRNVELAGRAKLVRLICIQRALSFGEKEVRPVGYEEWLKKVLPYIEARRVRPEVFWTLHEEYHDQEVADDIAWEAVAHIPDDIDPDAQIEQHEFEIQADELLRSIGEYLNLYPNGKYSAIALDRIISFCRICLGEDPLLPPPYGSSEFRIEATEELFRLLKKVAERNRSGRAINALEIFQKAFSKQQTISRAVRAADPAEKETPDEVDQTRLMTPTLSTKKRFVSAHEKPTSISGSGSLSASSK